MLRVLIMMEIFCLLFDSVITKFWFDIVTSELTEMFESETLISLVSPLTPEITGVD